MKEETPVSVMFYEFDWILTTRMIQNGLLSVEAGQKIIDDIEWKICQAWKFWFDTRHLVDDLHEIGKKLEPIQMVYKNKEEIKNRFIEMMAEEMQTNSRYYES